MNTRVNTRDGGRKDAKVSRQSQDFTGIQATLPCSANQWALVLADKKAKLHVLMDLCLQRQVLSMVWPNAEHFKTGGAGIPGP